MQQKWVSKLFGYDFTIEYRSGQSNTVVVMVYRAEKGNSMPSQPLFHRGLMSYVRSIPRIPISNSCLTGWVVGQSIPHCIRLMGAYSFIRADFICLMTPLSFQRPFISVMVAQLGAIMGSIRHANALRGSFIGRGWNASCTTMSACVICATETKWKTSILPDCFSHWRFLLVHGHPFLWILLKGYLLLMAKPR